MKFIDASGNVAKARRPASGSSSVHEEDVKESGKLTDTLRGMMRRISDSESRLPAEGVEFETDVSTLGATVSLTHNLNGPVRYTVVYWTKTTGGTEPTTAPVLVASDTSSSNTLVLKSYVAGRAIIRIESAFGVIKYA